MSSNHLKKPPNKIHKPNIHTNRINANLEEKRDYIKRKYNKIINVKSSNKSFILKGTKLTDRY